MNVVLLKGTLGKKGGLEKYTKRLASAFLEKNAKVSILTIQNRISEPLNFEGAAQVYPSPSEKDLAGYPFGSCRELCLPSLQEGALQMGTVHTFPVCRWPAFLRLEQFDQHVSRWLSKNPADVVFGMDRNRVQTHLRAGNGVHPAYLRSRLLSEGRIKYELCRINPLHRKIQEIEKEAFECPKLKKLFVNSYMVKNQVLEYYTVDPKKIEVVHNGVEWKEFETHFNDWQEKKQSILAAWNLNPDHLHLLFVGNGYRRKGLDMLLEALAIQKRPDIHLSVVGKDKNFERYQSKIIRMGLEKQVRLFGSQENIIPFYQLADALVIPSFYDPFANVTIEALAMGLFVISSNTNGGHEILTNSNGTIIENILSPESISTSLNFAPRKTLETALKIRMSVASFDFSYQLPKLIDACV